MRTALVSLGILVGAVVASDAAPPASPARRLTSSTYSDYRQLAVDGDQLYFLRRNGQILVQDTNGFRVYDPATDGTKQIAVDHGTCYALKNNGNVWSRAGEGSEWQQIDTGTGTKQMLAIANQLFVLKYDSTIWQHGDSGWFQIDSGGDSKALVGDRRGNVYVLKHSGNVWEYTAGNWVEIDSGVGTRQIAAAGGLVYALKGEGDIWRYDGSQWSQIDQSTGTKKIYASGPDLFALKSDGGIWLFKDGAWTGVSKEDVVDATVSHGKLYVLRPDGRVVYVDR
jgi:hypothetical protein